MITFGGRYDSGLEFHRTTLVMPAAICDPMVLLLSRNLQVLGLVCASLIGTFVWDRIITAIFAPKVFGAMIGEAKKTTTKDLVPIVSTAAKVAGGFILLAYGNVLLLGMVGYWYYTQQVRVSGALEPEAWALEVKESKVCICE